jgi:hypothetical protein
MPCARSFPAMRNEYERGQQSCKADCFQAPHLTVETVVDIVAIWSRIVAWRCDENWSGSCSIQARRYLGRRRSRPAGGTTTLLPVEVQHSRPLAWRPESGPQAGCPRLCPRVWARAPASSSYLMRGLRPNRQAYRLGGQRQRPAAGRRRQRLEWSHRDRGSPRPHCSQEFSAITPCRPVWMILSGRRCSKTSVARRWLPRFTCDRRPRVEPAAWAAMMCAADPEVGQLGALTSSRRFARQPRPSSPPPVAPQRHPARAA